MDSIPNRSARDKQAAVEQLARIATALERFVSLMDWFCRAYLRAKFPYGRHSDRYHDRGAA